MRKAWIAARFITLAPFMVSAAHAAEVKFLGGGPFQGSGKPVAEAFAKESRLGVEYAPGNSLGPALAKRLGSEDADIAIQPSDDMEAQVKAGLIKPDSVVVFARYRMGVGVAKGAPKPDVSTREKFRAALLAAKSIAIPDPKDLSHHTGQFMHGILIDLKIGDEIEKKAIISGRPASAVADGRAEMSIGSLPELMEEPKADVAGPVPADLPGYTNLSVGIVAKSTNPDAPALIRFLTGPQGRAVWTKTGLEPIP